MTKKRILAITAAMVLTLSLLAGCSSVPGMGGSSSSGGQSDKSTPSTPSSTSQEDQPSGDESSRSEGPFYIGDTISTAWFDYTVDSVEVFEEYEGRAAGEGNKLLVIQLSLKSTFVYSSDMYQDDFVVGWDEGEDFDYVAPLEAYCDGQFPDEYALKVNESRSGLLIYEVSKDRKDFWLNFLEVFDDDSYGESYFTYFTAE